MRSLQETILILQARLPELEWKLKQLDIRAIGKMLPKGLFISQSDTNFQSCIDEIRDDLFVLKKQSSERSAIYLTEQISRKVNVLIRICQLNKDSSKKKPHSFSMSYIGTRQQRLQNLQDEITQLEQQVQALSSAYKNLQQSGDVQAILNIQVELGIVEKRLTQAKETFAR